MRPSVFAHGSPRLLRHFMALLVFAFALASVAHAGHQHELSNANGTHAACDYCASFGSLADATVQVFVAPVWQATASPKMPVAPAPVCTRIETAAQPRAPPSC